jgi:hypothetical protein
MNAISSSPNLSQLEWRVVEIARENGPRSINPDGFWAQLSRDLFGLPVAQRLANEKLEALRRFCVRAWYWDLIPTSDLRNLANAGYSSAAVFQILAHIAGYRGFTPSIQEQPI